MQLTSNAFREGQEIPREYFVSGKGDIPPLRLQGVPAGAESLLLIFEDMDSPIGPLTHWIVWNLPPDITCIESLELPEGARVGMNGFGEIGFTVPAPPAGRHQFCFRGIALDQLLAAEEGERGEVVEQMAAEHTLASAHLTGYIEHSLD